MQHTSFFLYISYPLFWTTTTWNFHKLLKRFFMDEMSYVFSFTFFSLHSFSPCIGGRSISHFVTAALDLCCPFSRWASLACHLLSLFLCLSLALHSKFVDMTINLSRLNTLDNTDTQTISAFRFRLYWLFSCLCFARRRWLCDFPPKYHTINTVDSQ